MRLTALIGGIVTAVLVGHFTFQNQENVKLAVGAFDDPFVSIQLATDPDNGECLTTDGSNNVWSTSCGSGISSLNGLSASTQTFAVATSGNVGITVNSSGSVHTLTPTVASGFVIPSSTSLTNYNTAFGWGNHATQGYATNTAWQTNGTNVTLTTSTNKVGIGTTPASPLHLYQDDAEIGAGGGMTFEQDGTGDAQLQFLLTGVRRWTMGIDNSDSDKFKISPTLDVGTGDVMTIDTSGNVGVGTSSPAVKLDVVGSGAFNNVLAIRSTAGEGGQLIINDTGIPTTGESSNSWNIDNLGTAGSGTLRFFRSGTGIRMVMLSTGEIGIGLSAPTEKLHVSGGLRLTGAFKDSANATGTLGQILQSTGIATQWVSSSTIGVPSAASTTEWSNFYATPSTRILAGTGLSWSGNTLNASAGGTYGTSTWSSIIQGWVYPGEPACNADEEFTDGRFIHTLKPEYISLSATGTYNLKTVANNGCNAYTATTSLQIASSSKEQFITVSGDATGFGALMSSTSLMTTFINRSVELATTTNFTGIELDIEGYGSWSATGTEMYYSFIDEFAKKLHNQGKKLMVAIPPVWNSRANGDSGTGDEWDSATSSNYYNLKYEKLAKTQADYFVIMAYDYHFDYGNGSSIQPLKWVTDIVEYAKKTLGDTNRIVIGMPSYGYYGTTGGFSATNTTYTVMKTQTGSTTATRDNSSGELKWTNGGNSYVMIDEEGMNIKRTHIEKLGIKRISVWHLGGNAWFTEPDAGGKYELGNLADPTISLLTASSTGATTTDYSFMAGLFGIGTSTPNATLSIVGNAVNAIVQIFDSAKNKVFEIANNGDTYIRTKLSIATTTSSGVLNLGGSITHSDGSSQSSNGILVIADQKTQGTAGGTSNAGMNTRALNTVIASTTPGTSIASNQVTLPSGTWCIQASAPAFIADKHKLFWYNVTDSATTTQGQSAYTDAATNVVQTSALLDGCFTIAATKTFELRHYIQTSRATNGLGVFTGMGEEIYAQVRLEKK